MIVMTDNFPKVHLPLFLKGPIDTSLNFLIQIQFFQLHIDLNQSIKDLHFIRIVNLIVYFKAEGLQFLRSLHLVQFRGWIHLFIFKYGVVLLQC